MLTMISHAGINRVRMLHVIDSTLQLVALKPSPTDQVEFWKLLRAIQNLL